MDEFEATRKALEASSPDEAERDRSRGRVAAEIRRAQAARRRHVLVAVTAAVVLLVVVVVVAANLTFSQPRQAVPRTPVPSATYQP